MNIGLVNHWYPPEAAAGGVATYNTALARSLTRLGHSVVVVSSTREPKPRLETVDGICVVRLPYPRLSGRWDRLPVGGRQARALRTWLYARIVARALPALVEQHRLDLLEYADIEAEALEHRGRISRPYVIRLHGPLFALEPFYHGREQPFATGLIKRMERAAVIRADAWTAPSRFIADLVSSVYHLPGQRVSVVPNLFSGDDCEWTPPARPDPVILFVGRLESLKGADVLADAIPLVLRARPGVKFIYLAWDRPRPDGSSMKTFLRDRLARAGAAAAVEFQTSPGGCSYDRIRPDICVVPSRFETFSYPSFEAMWHGLPVVASRAAAIPELVRDGETGILVEPGNPRDLADGILKLATSDALRRVMGEAGRARTRRDYDPLALARQTVEVYERTLS